MGIPHYVWIMKRPFRLGLIAGLLVSLAQLASAQLTVTFLDVGQGDAALIRAPSGRTVLIDAGPSPRKVADWLRAARVDTIDLLVASHNHADHIAGVPAILASIPVRNYMENGMPATTRTYARIVTLLEERGIPVLRATPRRIDLGGGATLRVLAGAPNARTQNDASIGLELIYGSFRAFFTGDAEVRQRAFWAGDTLRPVQVLKVAHHGSSNGTDAKLIAGLAPCSAVISVGAKNGFHHPSPVVLQLLRSARVATYRTDLAGQVTVTADSAGAFSVTRGPRRPATTSFRPTCDTLATR